MRKSHDLKDPPRHPPARSAALMNARCARSSASSMSCEKRRAMVTTARWYRRTSASNARTSPARNAASSSASDGERCSGMEGAGAVARRSGAFHPANACGIRLCRRFGAELKGERRVLDLRWVVANLDEAKRRLSTRGPASAAALEPIEQLASERKALIQATETRRAEQKRASEQMRTLR